jgi:hypothetical protein
VKARRAAPSASQNITATIAAPTPSGVALAFQKGLTSSLTAAL